MAIIKQCTECRVVGKKMYCENCEKTVEYFEVFENVVGNNQNNPNNQNNKTTLIHTIKAFTWNDAIQFIKAKYFKDQNNLIIDCEKEFAYLERQTGSNNQLSNSGEQLTSYKIYLKNENELSFHKNSIASNMIDLTTIN